MLQQATNFQLDTSADVGMCLLSHEELRERLYRPNIEAYRGHQSTFRFGSFAESDADLLDHNPSYDIHGTGQHHLLEIIMREYLAH